MKGNDRCLFQKLEVIAGEELSDSVELRLHVFKSLEDLAENNIEDSEDFVVFLLDSHLDVETGVLGKVSMSVTVLCTKDRSDLRTCQHCIIIKKGKACLVNTTEISRNCHLLHQLRALSQESLSPKIVHPKHLCTTLCRRRL